jgi:hypothetical protein
MLFPADTTSLNPNVLPQGIKIQQGKHRPTWYESLISDLCFSRYRSVSTGAGSISA